MLNETGQVVQPYRFTTRPYNPVSGFIDLRARAYNPSIGRFIQRDPLGLDPDVNLYRYVGNNPINEIDPTGQWSIRIPDPSRIPGTNWCGIWTPPSGTDPETTGCIDDACKEHDACMKATKKSGGGTLGLQMCGDATGTYQDLYVNVTLQHN